MTSLDNLEVNSKNKSKQIDIDDVFDSMHDKITNTAKEKIKNLKRKHKLNVRNPQIEVDENESEVEDDYLDKLQWKQTNQKSIIDEPLEESVDKTDTQSKDSSIQKTLNGNNQGIEMSRGSTSEIRIDPNAFKNVKPKHLQTEMPDADKAECDALDDEEEADGYQLMNEAFSDEDVVEDFIKEKEEEVMYQFYQCFFTGFSVSLMLLACF